MRFQSRRTYDAGAARSGRVRQRRAEQNQSRHDGHCYSADPAVLHHRGMAAGYDEAFAVRAGHEHFGNATHGNLYAWLVLSEPASIRGAWYDDYEHVKYADSGYRRRSRSI